MSLHTRRLQLGKVLEQDAANLTDGVRFVLAGVGTSHHQLGFDAVQMGALAGHNPVAMVVIRRIKRRDY
ncbi:MAG TPA: hypothetical protein PKM73_20130 [Verrucomicrobiota bacterium]|nr:hypothetical protein [Verrucomicrobiota bacterium]HNU51518.1 hypothetical protein [Verrucomicrobiota bacterium]